jgi:predicted amidohydrolase YtcJ
MIKIRVRLLALFVLTGCASQDSGTPEGEAGKSADMVILNQNLLEIDETDIHKTLVQKTIFRGKTVYEKN